MVLCIVHSDFMLCCGSITRNDIVYCGSFTPQLFRTTCSTLRCSSAHVSNAPFETAAGVYNMAFATVADAEKTIYKEKQNQMQRGHLSNKQKHTRATYSKVHSEHRCSVNPDQRNRPGRKKHVIGFGQYQTIYDSACENHNYQDNNIKLGA